MKSYGPSTLEILSNIWKIGRYKVLLMSSRGLCLYNATRADVNYIYCRCLFVNLLDNINYYYFLHLAYQILSRSSNRHNSSIGEEDLDITGGKFILSVYFLFQNSESECFFLVTEINIFSSYQSTGFSKIRLKTSTNEKEKYFL